MKTKALPWFRFYTEAADDPKIARLSDPLHRFWVNCLCLAGRHQGVLPSIDDIAYHVRKPAVKVLAMRLELSACGLLDELQPDKFTPHNWASRQYEADVSTSRVKKFRERRKEPRSRADETVDETFHETQDTVSETVDETGGNRFMKRFPSVSVSDSVSGFTEKSARETTAILLDNFGPFLAAATECGLPASETDIQSAKFEWRSLDLEQKRLAIKGLHDRLVAGEFSDPAFRPLPQNYLKKRLWQRPVRASPRTAPSKSDRMMEIFYENMAEKLAKEQQR